MERLKATSPFGRQRAALCSFGERDRLGRLSRRLADCPPCPESRALTTSAARGRKVSATETVAPPADNRSDPQSS